MFDNFYYLLYNFKKNHTARYLVKKTHGFWDFSLCIKPNDNMNTCNFYTIFLNIYKK